jgi:hypothetical protein
MFVLRCPKCQGSLISGDVMQDTGSENVWDLTIEFLCEYGHKFECDMKSKLVKEYQRPDGCVFKIGKPRLSAGNSEFDW